MACTIIPHTSLEQAVSLLAAHLDRHQAGSPLASATVLVQGAVIGRWLATELAARSAHGISAGLDLRPVGAFCRALVAPTAGPDPYGVEALIWTIDAALADAAWLAGLEDGDGLRHAVAALDRAGRHALAVQLAGILDRYQFERPQWIAAWSAGARIAEAPEPPWLRGLWARVRALSGALAPLSVRLQELARALRSGGAPLHGVPPELWLLAPSSLPPLFTELLGALGDGGVAVHILLLVPARHDSMWAALENEREDFDPETTPLDQALSGAHPLLGAYARQAHDLAVLLADAGGGDGRMRTVDLDQLLGEAPAPDAPLLAQLQEQIRAACAGTLLWRGATDHSLSVHRCHSPLREVEALRDALVEELTLAGTAAGGPATRPDQVLVAVTDLPTYAPLLQAVLGDERGDGVAFPVRVVGESAAADPLVTALLSLLALPGSTASLAAVLAPFDAAAVRRRFALGEEDLDTLQHRLVAAGVSWGLDAGQRARATGYAVEEGSWRRGVDRLLQGLIMGPDGVLAGEPGEGVRYAAGAALLGDAPALGGLAVYLELLRRFSDAVGDGTRELAVAEWRTLLFALFDDCAAPESGDEVRALQLLRGALAAIPRTAAAPDLRTIRKHLERMLAQEGSASSWARGGIIVAPLAALRHAPHRFIAVLGLGSDFPSVRPRSAFDPAAARRRRGDLSQRLDARQLFLDLLLAARSRLHLSWSGFAAGDGAEREPAAVVEDLLRYLDQRLVDSGARRLGRAPMLIAHRLHGSSAAYFERAEGELPHSFDALACAAANARRQRDAGAAAPAVARFLTAPSPLPPPSALAPSEMVRWTCDPARAFAESLLALRFSELATLPEHEPITLDGLSRWQLRQRLLAGMLGGDAPDEERLRQDGLLPHGPAGSTALAALRDEAAAIGARVDAALAALALPRAEVLRAVRTVDCALPEGGAPARIAGTVQRCHPRVVVLIHDGKLHGHHLLAGWTLHQLLHADSRARHLDGDLTTLVFGASGPRGGPLCGGFCRFPAAVADPAHWQAIVAALRASWRAPTPCFPDLAYACSDWRNSGQIDAQDLAAHLAAWRAKAEEGDERSLRSELATPKPWHRLLWRGVADPTAATLLADGLGWDWFCEHIWQPAAAAASFAMADAP